MQDSYPIEMVSLDVLVSKDHPYRKLRELIDFKKLTFPLDTIVKNQFNGAKGYGVSSMFCCLLLQFMEDLSDREAQRYFEENNAAKWFCDFSLTQRTPDYSLFSKIRKKIGTTLLSKLFERVRGSLKQQGYMSEVFTFVDASHLISKANIWETRDKVIEEKLERLNNETLPKVAKDKQARFGCKGKKKFWYGYKKHVSVDMQSGLINKVAVTPANTTDGDGLSHVCPNQGAVYADKGYCGKKSLKILKKKGCHDAIIKKNNMRSKNKSKDRWLSTIRSPYERVFSKASHTARYHGVGKNQFQQFMEAMAFNFKRLLRLDSPPLQFVVG